jgi:cation diffusion facilitator family transporter
MKEKIAAISILANIVLAGGKMVVGLFSGSVAVLAEGIHSLMDIFSSTISFVGIKISKKPADEKYPYGRYKFEVLAGVIITLILLITGFGVLREAYNSYLNPQEIKIEYLAFGVMIFSALVNEIMARLKIYFGKKENSVALLSDGLHSRVDVFTSLAVLAGLFLTKYWIMADALLALLIGLYIIKESFSLGKDSINSLLDVSAGQEVEDKIKALADSEKISLSKISTQKKGSIITANLEISLPLDLKVEEATKISEKLRESLMEEIENLQYVTIQITSHEVETNFYKPEIGRGFGWQRKGRYKGEVKEAIGSGPGGSCFCSKCGYKTEHQKGVPCSTLKCPRCGSVLSRK